MLLHIFPLSLLFIFVIDVLVRFVSSREHAKKFKSEDMEMRMEGKNCVVTGANSGIGFATAEGLASR